MNGLEPKHLKVVERWTLILAAAALACGYLAAPRAVAVGIAVGAGLMCVNAWAIRKLVEKALPRVGDNAPALGVLLFNVKLLVLAGLVVFAVKVLGLDAIGLLIGISVFPLAIVVAALRIFSAGASEPPHDDLTTPTPTPAGDR